jgi:hypothetical protein
VARLSARTGWALVLLAVLAGACSTPQKPSALHHEPPTTGKVSVRLEVGGITVTPSDDLHDGQQVDVGIRGFPAGWKIFVSECWTPLEANSLGCGGQLAIQPFGFSEQAGRARQRVAPSEAAPLGGVTDIGEQHGRQDPVDLYGKALAG